MATLHGLLRVLRSVADGPNSSQPNPTTATSEPRPLRQERRGERLARVEGLGEQLLLGHEGAEGLPDVRLLVAPARGLRLVLLGEVRLALLDEVLARLRGRLGKDVAGALRVRDGVVVPLACRGEELLHHVA